VISLPLSWSFPTPGVTPERMINDILGVKFGPDRYLQTGGLESLRR